MTAHEIPRLTCLNQPTKREMVEMFKEAVDDGIQQKKPFVISNRVGLLQLIDEIQMKGKMPDKDWLMVLLAKIPGKSCPIFAKGYVPPTKPQLVNRPEVTLNNHDGFWTGLSGVSSLGGA